METNSPPLEYGLDLVASFFMRNVAEVTVHDFQGRVTKGSGSSTLCPREARCNVMRTLNRLWKGPHGETLKPPANDEYHLISPVSEWTLDVHSHFQSGLLMSPQPCTF